MRVLRNLLLENKAWVAEKLQVNENYFSEVSKEQTPQYLWIGCADSRVNPSDITGTSLGEMFVHRNIANLFFPDDLNIMSVITYAVEYLKVKHIIICGHYGCGGVMAAMSDQSFGIIDRWLLNIKNVMQKHKTELDGIADEKAKVNRLVELNVCEQIRTLSEVPMIAEKIKAKELVLHGWIYEMSKGTIKDVLILD